MESTPNMFTLVIAYGDLAFRHEIEKLMADGWILHGYPFMQSDGGRVVQAMIKHDPAKNSVLPD